MPLSRTRRPRRRHYPPHRAALQEAEDALATLVATKTNTRESTLPPCESNASVPRRRRSTSAVSRVLLAEGAPAVAALVRELELLHAQMVDKHLALRALARVDAVVLKADGLYTDAGQRRVAVFPISPPEYWNDRATRLGPISAAWASNHRSR